MSLAVQYLLDTNMVSDLARNPQGACATRIVALGEEAIGTSIVVAAELQFGLAKLEFRKSGSRLSANLRAILGEIQILPFESPADEHYGNIRQFLEKSGRPDWAERPSDCCSCQVAWTDGGDGQPERV